MHKSVAYFSTSQYIDVPNEHEHFSFRYMKLKNEVTVVWLATFPGYKSISLDMEHALYGLLLIGCLDIT
ncbi:Os07g0184500 [Oryza sativa Japonica Group]|jgi:hypothetical protein|uniref:Os07g0184500 protein n=1 Tax=Oryza sativa subsp. japonica TaxID=39947 RepID=A0A0P0X3H9_ORYSJ|nr:hypothetical protein EE612_037526 [Oryza sativa]BAT00350.1 Os07g0184500 [Oryza sativa Japonica Group]